MLQLGDKKISELYLGEKKVSEVYLGEEKIRPVGGFTLTANTIAYYPLSSDSKDYSGKGKHGTISGAVSFVGGRSVFNGGYINPGFQFPTESFTLSLWAKTDREYKVSNNTRASLVGKYWGGLGGGQEAFIVGVSCRTSDNQLAGVWTRDKNGTASSDNVEHTRMNIGERHHILVTYDKPSRNLSLATDGLKRITENRNFVAQEDGNPYIGAMYHRTSGATNRFYGSIQEVIFENKSWSDQEIASYYNSTKGQFGL
ncbi:hypothetical protein BSK20_03570 [SR1 bacterium human oral taxon HOT-345]|nr:hypothetical protein BSK20_03570 [SR1 bacterium human oral taxon HOT-345]